MQCFPIVNRHKQSFDSCQVVIKQSSGSCRGVVRQSSESCQVVFRQLFIICIKCHFLRTPCTHLLKYVVKFLYKSFIAQWSWASFAEINNITCQWPIFTKKWEFLLMHNFKNNWLSDCYQSLGVKWCQHAQITFMPCGHLIIIKHQTLSQHNPTSLTSVPTNLFKLIKHARREWQSHISW